ncbi:MDR family MFS transporter [Agrococcus jejuensis]|uniref:MFS transporter, DHA2 family, lincomycin resistance protein n=1 Tax=Agrococcus jejuensis TaxID=399736 RepID=A0A1G8DHG4_9MICO|nr:MDR family MFS transporter [Agrococcus jejuensis]SDH57081.1 MFS transporter, DHA2 family, lincomycin resistance protein [Agrococcus jejuensis]
MTTATASTPTIERVPPRPGPVLALLVASAFVVILNETIMGVAIPQLTVDLGITTSTAQWLTTGFLLTMAVVIPTTGFLLQRFPLRSLFFVAMGLFTAGTLVAALAPGFGMLLVGRVVQAAGTAIMMPLLFTTVLSVIPPERRGRFMGVVSVVIAVAPAVGPTVSGLILSTFEWRWLFIFVLPIAVLSLILGSVFVKNLTETQPSHLDVVSIPLAAVGFGGLVYGLASIGESAEGHSGVPLWVPIGIGVAALAAFVWRQLALGGTDRVLLNLSVFRTRSFTLAVLLVVVVFAVLLGTLILLPLYLQNVLGLDTLATGLMLLPGGVLMGVLAPIVGNLFDRFGPRPLVLPAAIVTSAALWWMTTLDADSTVPTIIAMHLVLNAGLAFMFTPLLTSALGSLPRRLYSHGSAIMSTLQQVAGAAGTALFVTLMAVGASAAAAEGVAHAAAATSAGVHTAFLVGACLSLAAVVLAAFVRGGAATDEVEADAPVLTH